MIGRWKMSDCNVIEPCSVAKMTPSNPFPSKAHNCTTSSQLTHDALFRGQVPHFLFVFHACCCVQFCEKHESVVVLHKASGIVVVVVVVER